MTIIEFKFIYWMEYFHRLLGRLIGLFFVIPLIVLWRKLPSEFKKKSLFILCLGALQGAMGWYMVKSGLSKDPSVCHYRLTVHLFLAFILMGLLVRSIVKLKKLPIVYTKKITLLHLTVSYIIFTIIYGGFVAGLKAGLIYNTFPLMDGAFIPDDFFHQKPLWTNFLSNPATVQWIHRIFALLALLHVFLFLRRENNFYTRIWLGLIITQVLLGVLTLIYQVPIDLGTMHQGLGALIFSWSIVVLTLHKKQKEL